jgi:hypothetical protein
LLHHLEEAMSRPRRHSLDEVHAPYVWRPGPEPLYLDDPKQLIAMAFWFVPDIPVERDLFILLAEDDRVVSMLCDPTPALKANLTRTTGPGFEEPFTKVVIFVHRDEVLMEPPSDTARAWYQLHRTTIEAQGLELVDFIEFDTETMRSYAALEGRWDGSGEAA